MCTRRRVIAVWLCTALILAAISFHFFVTVTYPHVPTDPVSSETNSTLEMDPICYVQPDYEWFFVDVWYWLDFTLLAFVPFVVILTGNWVIVVCVVRAVRFRYRQDSAFPPSSGGVVAAERGKAVTSSTVMLMTLSVVFFLTTSPNVIYFLKIDDWLEDSNDASSQARLHLAFTVTTRARFNVDADYGYSRQYDRPFQQQLGFFFIMQ